MTIILDSIIRHQLTSSSAQMLCSILLSTAASAPQIGGHTRADRSAECSGYRRADGPSGSKASEGMILQATTAPRQLFGYRKLIPRKASRGADNFLFLYKQSSAHLVFGPSRSVGQNTWPTSRLSRVNELFTLTVTPGIIPTKDPS